MYPLWRSRASPFTPLSTGLASNGKAAFYTPRIAWNYIEKEPNNYFAMIAILCRVE
jgi:hypothetical protein